MEEIQEQPPKLDKRKKHIEYNSYKEYVKETKYNTRYYHQSKKAIECPICQKSTYERTLFETTSKINEVSINKT